MHALLFLPLLACTTPDFGDAEDGEVETDGGGADGGADGGDTDEPIEDAPPEQVGPAPDRTNEIFDPRVVHTLDITLRQEDAEALYNNSEAYASTYWVPATIVYDGLRVEEVGLRLKGRWGSWRNLSGKAALKIDMGHYRDGQELLGLETLTMNNMVVDYSYQRERLAYRVYDAVNLPNPRTAYTWITINDTDFGLYLNVETPDRHYLERWFADGSGNLYDADYVIWEDGTYTTLDFYTSRVELFELEEGDDIGGADIMAVTNMLDGLGAEEDLIGATSSLIDWDNHLKLMAVEMWVGHIDGYSMNQNNYLPYFDPTTGQVSLLAWDHDYAFLHESDWGFSWSAPRGRLSALCVQNAQCVAALTEKMAEVLDAADGLDLATRMAEERDLIAPYVDADPRREQGMDYVVYYRDLLDAWIVNRPAELRSWFSL